ncbi:MAG: hypothetical protein AAGF12_29210 [Myxococcota bacterium]
MSHPHDPEAESALGALAALRAGNCLPALALSKERSTWGAVAHLHLLAAGAGRAGPVPKLQDFGHGPAQAWASVAWAHIAFLQQAPHALEEARHHLRGASQSDDRELSRWATARLFWTTACVGEGSSLTTVDDHAALARSQRRASLTVEYTVLGALIASQLDDSDGARRRARSASRMARTESIPSVEVLAHWCLARQRRLDGRPFLTRGILQALQWHRSGLWRNILGLEAFFAGDQNARPELARVTAESLRTLRRDFRLHPLCADADRWIAAVDTNVEVHPQEPWAAGRQLRPYGLDGWLEREGAWILVQPGHPARRLLWPGANALEVPRVEAARQEPRAAIAVATLAFLNHPISPEDLFERVYGVGYRKDRHYGLLRTLMYRMRRGLGDRAVLERDREGLRLAVHRPILLRDPRNEIDVGDEVLRYVASHPNPNAKEISAGLGRPLRTVQRVLRELLESELCSQERDGRKTVYTVEDTTFSAPTRTLFPAATPTP